MSSQKKPRPDSQLKTLPEERQAQIIEMLAKKSHAAVAKELAADGLITSRSALSEFYSWWHLRQQLTENENTVEMVLERMQSSNPDLTRDQLFSAGQAFFSALAIQQQDAKSWKRTQDLRIKQEVLVLEKEKFRRETCELFLKWFENEQAKSIASSGATNKEKIQRLGQLMFGEEWEDSPSGAIK
jgi:hypothetical protein